MHQDINLAGLTDLQCGLNQFGNVVEVHHTGFAENGLCSDFINLVHNFLCPFLAALGDIVDDNIGTTFRKQDGNTGTDSSNKVLAHSFIWKKRLARYLEDPVTMAVLPLRERPVKSDIVSS